MKKDTVWLIIAVILLVGVIGGLIWIFTGSRDVDTDLGNGEDIVVDDTTEDSEETEEVDFEEVDVDSSVPYSSSAQTVGSVTDSRYELEDISVKKGTGVVEISFFLKPESESNDGFQVVAQNNSGLGVLDIRLKGVETYSADLSYGERIAVDYEGVSGLSKVIEGVEDEERFYLGISSTVEFYVFDFEDTADGRTLVKISVKYPGGEIVSSEAGTTEFTSEDLSFDGNDTEGEAKIVDYDYIYSAGSLKFNLQVTTGSSIVIPSFSSTLDSGVLVVTFPSLATDKVFSWDSTLELPMGVTLVISRSGSVSTYTFTGVGSTYRIFGETNPNQLVIDMSR